MDDVTLKLYDIFKQDFNFTNERARVWTHTIERAAKEEADKVFQSYKSDIREDFLKMELKIEQTKSDLELKIEHLKSDLELKIEQNKNELKLEIEHTKNETVKWVIGTAIALAGLIIAVAGVCIAFIL